MNNCLIEVGTEELPPRALRRLSQDFARLVQKGLQDAERAAQSVEVFATPRRLAMLLADLPLQQSDRRIEKRGPALAAAFDADGNPSKAASGFAALIAPKPSPLAPRSSTSFTSRAVTIPSAVTPILSS